MSRLKKEFCAVLTNLDVTDCRIITTAHIDFCDEGENVALQRQIITFMKYETFIVHLFNLMLQPLLCGLIRSVCQHQHESVS